ncbi:MAG: hypothetical protein M3680_11890 [Myxococcota bacterium]|nr:hypothetical protein [Myxococcota bacterium]
MRALVLVLAACAAAPRAPALIANRAAPPPRPACTDEQIAAFAQQLQARWRTTEVPLVRCLGGRFPAPGYFLAVQLEGNRHLAGIIDAGSSNESAPFRDEPAPTAAAAIAAYDLADLDGDGTDEIIETWRESARGGLASGTWLAVRRLEDRALTRIEGPHTDVYHRELGSCSADVQLADRTIVITIAVTRLPPSDCLPAGTHTFALADDRVIKLAPGARP